MKCHACNYESIEGYDAFDELEGDSHYVPPSEQFYKTTLIVS